MLQMSRAIVARVRALNEAPHIVSANDAILLPGPPNGDMWKIRMYRNGRGIHHVNVRVPGLATPKYSLRGVLDALGQFGVDIPEEDELDIADDDDLQELLEELEEEVGFEDAEGEEEVEVAANPLRHMAAFRITTIFRAYMMWKKRARVRRIEEEIARAIQSLNVARVQAEAAGARMEEISSSEAAYRIHHPDVIMNPPVTFIDFRTTSLNLPMTDLRNMISHESGFTRNIIDAHALKLVSTSALTTTAHKCGRSHSRLHGHGAIIIGDLPMHIDSFIACDLMGERTYVYADVHPDEAWMTVTSAQFGSEWAAQMSQMDRTDITFLTFFSDRHRRTTIGALAISRKLVRKASIFYPAVSIESIASRESNHGTGKKMIELARQLLFSDLPDVTFGLMFAQCVRIPFWGDRMDETREARSLIMQMEKLYPSYPFERRCLMRATWVTFYDDLPSPAPMNVVP